MKNTDIIPGKEYAEERWEGYITRVRVLAVERRSRKVYPDSRSFHGHNVEAPMVHIQRLRADGEKLGESEWVLPRTIVRTWEDQLPIERAKREREAEKDAGVQRAKDLEPAVKARIKERLGDRAYVPTSPYTPGGKVTLTFEQFLTATSKEDA